MITIIKPGIWKILKIFYNNKNMPVHLRGIARLSDMNESTASLHLNSLVKNGILKAVADGNLKKFFISLKYIPLMFPIFDNEKLESLPILRKNAIKMYIEKLEKKPLILVVFGSTAKGNFKNDSDLDILEITDFNDNKAKKFVEAQTGISIQSFKITEEHFIEEISLKKDKVIASAINTGFPVFNQKYYYEVIYHE